MAEDVPQRLVEDASPILPSENLTFDYIVVGAGSAGSVLAKRLSPDVKLPTLTSGNTNAPSIMIGEKASRMILAAA